MRSEYGKSGGASLACIKRALFIAAVAALAFKLALALTTYGTNDVVFWEANHAKIRADGGLALYRDGAIPVWNGTTYPTEPFNQPPFVVHLLLLLGAISDATGLPLRFWLRAASSIADAGSLWLVWKIASKRAVPPRLSLFAVALSPVAILVAGFHGNTDPIMMLFLLLSIYLVESGASAWLAGAALGMAVNIKIVPALFAPAILLYVPGARRRAAFLLACGAAFAAGSAPYLYLDAPRVISSVFGYNSAPGGWGLSALASIVQIHVPGTADAYRAAGKLIAVAAVLGVSLARREALTIFERCSVVAFTFLFFASGFSVHYLAWLVPWYPALEKRSRREYYVLSAALAVAFYAIYSHGSWYASIRLQADPPPAGQLAALSVLRMICWAWVGVAAVKAWRLGIRTHSSVQLLP